VVPGIFLGREGQGFRVFYLSYRGHGGGQLSGSGGRFPTRVFRPENRRAQAMQPVLGGLGGGKKRRRRGARAEGRRRWAAEGKIRREVHEQIGGKSKEMNGGGDSVC